jgi:hypothetical protein
MLAAVETSYLIKCLFSMPDTTPDFFSFIFRNLFGILSSSYNFFITSYPANLFIYILSVVYLSTKIFFIHFSILNFSSLFWLYLVCFLKTYGAFSVLATVLVSDSFLFNLLALINYIL